MPKKRAAAVTKRKPAAVRARTGVSPATSDPLWGTARSMVTANPVERDPYRGHATVYRCVRVIVGALMRAPLVAKKGTRPNGTLLENGPWSELLLHPNPNMTRRQLVEATGTYLLTTGECAWYLEGKSGPATNDEVPTSMWPLPKWALEPILDERTRTVLLGWRITTPTGQFDAPARSVLLHRYSFDPANPLRGLGPIGAAAVAMRSDMKAEAWSEAFFDNSAEPGGVLSTEGVLTPKQREDMRLSWEAKHGGPSRRGRVAVLEGGLTYQQLGLSQRDMDFIEQRKWNDTQIARVFGVPKFFLMEGTDISYASTRQNKRALWELAVMPIVDAAEDVMEAGLTSTRDARVWCEFDVSKVEALKEDLAANLDSAERLTRIGYPVNEVNERLDLGMPRQPWGDTGTLPMGVAPADAVLAGDGSGGTDGGEPPPDAPDAGGDNGKPPSPEGDGTPLPQEDKPPESTGKPPPGRVVVASAEDAAREARARRVASWALVERGVMRPATGRFHGRVRGFLNGRKAEVLRFVSGLDTRAFSDLKGLDARALPPDAGGAIDRYLADAKARWAGLLAKQMRPVYRDTVRQAATQLGKELGGLRFFDMGDPAVAAFLHKKEVLVTSVSDTVTEGLRGTLIDGLTKAEDVNQLQDRVRLVFRAGNNRSLTIARTEAAQSTNGARHLAMTAEKVEEHEWLTSEDEAVRDETASLRLRPKADHRSLDGTVVPLGATFVGGLHLHHPGDVAAPPWWVINCRCVAGVARRSAATAT